MSFRKDPSDSESQTRPKWKRAYQPPKLVLYGDLKKVTMGVSPGVGDSLDPFTRKNANAPSPPPGK